MTGSRHTGAGASLAVAFQPPSLRESLKIHATAALRVGPGLGHNGH